ncbi:MAG: peptidoglycan DD-metalloendopeptidase family protein [Gammaproteobacteria bacterium]
MGLLLLGLAGCAYDPLPVSESKVVTKRVGGSTTVAPAAAPGKTPEHYVVQQGDTLFSIAWRHGLDYREVAAINGIGEPWVIRVGQKIRLLGKKPKQQQAAASPAVAPARTEAAAVKPAAPVAAAPAAGSGAAAGEVGRWQWPADGRVLAPFSASGSGPKGISIEGKSGDPVRAAGDGQVVYTGSSLVGYGQLVILKHDEVFLSAYAHNSRLLVREGEKVKAGQAIAEMGSTGADRVKLHFEIRRNGQPVDPVGVLPTRR